MKFGSLLHIVPGLQLVYMAKAYMQMQREDLQSKSELEKLTDRERVLQYIDLRNQAQETGNSTLAKFYDQKLAELAILYLR